MNEFFWFNRDIIRKPCFRNPLCTVVMITLAAEMDESNQTHEVSMLIRPIEQECRGVETALQMLEEHGILQRDTLHDCVQFDPQCVAYEAPKGA